MKLLTGCLVLIVLATASGADAWPWSRKKGLPKPIDSPVVRPKNQTLEKLTRMKHRSVYDRYGWGAEWDKTLNLKQVREGNHSIFRD